MSKLLITVKSDPLRKFEVIPKELQIYDDKIVFRDKGMLSHKESTILYPQVSQVVLNQGLVHSTLEIVNTGGFKNIKIEHIKKDLAMTAKESIEEIMRFMHSGGAHPQPQVASADPKAKLKQLKEMLDEDLITQEEYEQKRAALLKDF
jgi:hypothetical protein